MGTSNAYKGRPDTGRLLPPEAKPPFPPEQQPQPEPQLIPPRLPPIKFQQARAILTRSFGEVAAGVGSRVAYSKVASSYVRASGGPQIAAQSSVAGRQGAQQLMGFLGGVAENGIAETIKRFKVGDLANLPPDVVLQRLVDTLFPNADTREEALARDCGARTLQEWLSQFDLSNGDISKLDSTELNDVPQLIKDYLVNYIADRMDNELLSWAEQSGDIQAAMDLSDGMRDYVAGELNNIIECFENTSEVSSWTENIEEISERLFFEAFALIEIPKEEEVRPEKSPNDSGSNEARGDND